VQQTTIGSATQEVADKRRARTAKVPCSLPTNKPSLSLARASGVSRALRCGASDTTPNLIRPPPLASPPPLPERGERLPSS
jgi:hypothetical protein